MENLTPSLSSPDSNAQLLLMLSAEKNRRQTENRLAYYKPYPKQAEFHAAKARERLLMAGNQLGKTLAGGFEAAMHATGRYPSVWKGRRFDRPTVGWNGPVWMTFTPLQGVSEVVRRFLHER